MLVLTRKANETIVIDGNIHIKVLSIRGSQIRLGIEAPDEVRIYREELCASTRPVAEPAAVQSARAGRQ
jgi:carbon storage regulator